ncbi:hypothetical protein TWF718_005274 [Orbilia javanica]|uniref:Uncharacterized protein n=1 Tax=Orbilia javanica TaxID=47235 RepID=A0AAN8MPQ3_9PEZI
MALTLLTLLDPGQPILYTRIFEHLGAVDTINLLATCRQTMSLKGHVFNVNVLLRPFFKDPLQFRQVMADNDLVVGGSMALRFFSREKWESNDIDVYTESHESVAIAAAFLQKKGYQYEPYFWQTQNLSETIARRDRVKEMITEARQSKRVSDDTIKEEGYLYGIEEIKDIYRFSHPGSNKKIEVVLTRGSVVQLILSYYATFLMNFFTYRTAYSLFPSSTFRGKNGFYVPPKGRIKEKTMNGILKYHDRGYSILTNWREDYEYKSCARLRTVGDCNTWSIPLCTRGIDAPSRDIRLQGISFIVTPKPSIAASCYPPLWYSYPFAYYEALERELRETDRLVIKMGKSRPMF